MIWGLKVRKKILMKCKNISLLSVKIIDSKRIKGKTLFEQKKKEILIKFIQTLFKVNNSKVYKL